MTVTNPLGQTTHFRYDARGNVTSQTDTLGNVTTFAYNLADQPTTTTLPQGVQNGTWNYSLTHSYRYPGGALYKTEQSGQKIPQQAVITAVNYTLGKEGELLGVSGNTQPASYEYDALYRLTKIKDGKNNATTYAYDTVGNLATVTYPDLNTVQYTSYTDAGRLKQRIDPRGITANYEYKDVEGLLTGIAFPASAGTTRVLRIMLMVACKPIQMRRAAQRGWQFGMGRERSGGDGCGTARFSASCPAE